MDRDRIDDMIESEGLSPDSIEETSEFEGGVLIAFRGKSQPFWISDQENHFIGYEDDRDLVLNAATGVLEDMHVTYVMRHTSLVNAFDPDDDYDGAVWIGDAAPNDAVKAHMTATKHTRMLEAAQTWMLHASMMFEQIPEDVEIPSTMANMLEIFNRRFARSMER